MIKMHISPKSFQLSTDSRDRPCSLNWRSMTALLKRRTARSTVKNMKKPIRMSSRALIPGIWPGVFPLLKIQI